MVAEYNGTGQPLEEAGLTNFGGKLTAYVDPDGLPFWVGDSLGTA